MQPRPHAAIAAKEAVLCWALVPCPEEVPQAQGSPWFPGLDAVKGQATGTLAYWHLVPARACQGWMRKSRAGRSHEKKQSGSHILWPCYEIHNLSHLGSDEGLKKNNGQGPRTSSLFEKAWVRNGFHVRGQVLVARSSVKARKQGLKQGLQH